MAERIYQFDFNGFPWDVTPKNFKGFKIEGENYLGRFVRETKGEYYLTSPLSSATYFMEKIFKPFEDFVQEEMWAVFLNTKLKATHEALMYRGTVNSILLRPVELFREAVKLNTTGIVLGHVHPSGDPTPSLEDITTTQHIYAVSKLLEIALYDHIVVGKNAWVSLRQSGLGFKD